MTVNQESLRRSFAIDETAVIPIGFFVEGTPYRLWGLFEMDTHLIGPLDSSKPMNLLGTDSLGRDLMSPSRFGSVLPLLCRLHGLR